MVREHRPRRARRSPTRCRQLRTLEAYHTFGDIANRPAIELCDRLAQLAPMADAKIFLTSGGGDTIEAAAKLARRHFVNLGQPERVHLISRTQGYHGTHGFGTSLGGIEPNVTAGARSSRTPHRPVRLARGARGRDRAVGPDKVAAFFCEPVIGAGGVLPAARGLHRGRRRLCAEHGILLVIDSVICGFGRLGTWFGIERWPDVEPDMIAFAKGVTSGYLPLGGVVVAATDRRAVLRGRRGADVPPRSDLRRPSGVLRRRDRRARHRRARATDRARQELERPLADALGPLADHPARVEVRGGPGLPGRGRRSRPDAAPVRAGSLAAGARRRACWCARCSAGWRCPRRSRASPSTSTFSRRRSRPDWTM